MTTPPNGAGRRQRLVIIAVGVALWVTAGLVWVGLRSPSPDEPRIESPACGDAVAKPGGGRWTCTFADDFSGASLDGGKWVPVKTAVNGFRNGPECYVDSQDNVSVANGVLTLTARREAKPFTCASPFGSFTTEYTGGYVTTWRRFSQAFGRFEFRARFPDTKVVGVHSALWLWPDDAKRYGESPASGEIDVAEFYSAYPDRAVPYVHYVGDKLDPNATSTTCMIARPEDFHTYVLVWTPQTLTIEYDGNVCLVDDWQPTTMAKPAPFDQPFYLNLTQALGNGANTFDAATTPVPATMQVDYVRVWS